MNRFAALLLPLLALGASPALADAVVETVEVTEVVSTDAISTGGSERYVVSTPALVPQGIARFGPFRVLDGTRAALVDADPQVACCIGPTLLGLPAFGLMGFVGAVLGGLWLLRSIWRSSRQDED